MAESMKEMSKYQPKMIKLCDWPYETKLVIVVIPSSKKQFLYRYEFLLSFIVITNHSQSLLA